MTVKNLNYTDKQLEEFLIESNKIEATTITDGEMDVAEIVLSLDKLTISDISNYVQATEPSATLRNRHGMNVLIGDHKPMPGGPEVVARYMVLLNAINAGTLSPYEAHQAYEALHPYTDGNGRSGRLIWAWQMLHQNVWPRLALGFLHAFYYQSLANNRE